MDFSLLKNYKYYLILIQLALITYFIDFFNIGESFKLNLLFIIFCSGFIMNSLVNVNYKKYTYILTFLVGLFWIMTWQQALKFCVVFSFILLIINLPIKLIYRKILIVIITLCLVLIKSFDVYEILNSNVISLLACVFMFRAIIYLYELKYLKNTISFLNQVNYFISPSNLTYPIFPVIDFKTFTNSFYNTNALHIYQKGVLTITRGLLHIYAYRIIESIQYLDVYQEKSSFGLLINILFSFAFVIRLSGILHFNVGVIQLFGYNLPDIFNNYFLSKGFADFWRRINIYWKDFILKIIFNPLYFKLKKKKIRYVLSITTIIAFLVTILFHSYQFFWLTGSFELKDTDLFFWLGFGLLIVLETNLPSLKKSKSRVINYSVDGLKIGFTLFIIAVLWYIWNFESLKQALNAVKLYNLNLKLVFSFLLLLALVLLLTVSNFLFDYFKNKKNIFISGIYLNSLLMSILVFTFCLIKSKSSNLSKKQYSVYEHFVNGIDSNKALVGYYENSLNANFVSLRRKIKEKRVKTILIDTTDCSSTPNKSLNYHKGIYYNLNKHGLREKITELSPTANYRINLHGGSNEFGLGVYNTEMFDYILEEKLRESYNIEILNFSFPSRGLFMNINDFLIKGQEFNPSISVFFYHSFQERKMGEYFLYKFKDCNGSSYLNNLRSTNKWVNGSQYNLINEVESYKQSFKSLAEKCKKINTVPLLILMPIGKDEYNFARLKVLEEVKLIASQNKILVVDITDVFNKKDYKLSTTDSHYNKEGHKLIGDSLTVKFKNILNQLNVDKGLSD